MMHPCLASTTTVTNCTRQPNTSQPPTPRTREEDHRGHSHQGGQEALQKTMTTPSADREETRPAAPHTLQDHPEAEEEAEAAAEVEEVAVVEMTPTTICSEAFPTDTHHPQDHQDHRDLQVLPDYRDKEVETGNQRMTHHGHNYSKS